MDWQRNLLIGAIVIVLAVLFVRWNAFQDEQIVAEQETRSEEIVVPEVNAGVADTSETDAGIPAAAGEVTSQPAATPAADSRLITVTSDTLQLTIDTYGGDIVKAALLEFPVSQDTPDKPFVMLNRTSDTTYIAQSGLIGANGTDTNAGRPRYRVSSDRFSLASGADEVVVNLQLDQGDALITKQFVLSRGDYVVKVNYLVENRAATPWQAAMFGQIQRDSHEPPAGDGVGMAPYLGAAITTPTCQETRF